MLLGFTLCVDNFAYAQGWGASTFSQTTNEANDVETNSTGESYMCGYFSGQTNFSPMSGFTGSNGSNDAYVAKYDASGNLVWIQQFGGGQDDRAIDLEIGADQNIVVTGSFFGSVTFGSTTLTSTSSSKDFFVLKMDPAGNVIWAKREGGSGIENAYKLTIDAANNIIITGEFQGNSIIGGNTFNSTINTGSGNPSFDIFVLKYNSAGTAVWTVTGAGQYDDRGLSVAIDNASNVYLTGQFSDNITFAGTPIVNNGFNIGYLAKLNSAGQFQFFNQFKAGLVSPYDIEINSNNESIVIGDFLGNMTYAHQGGNTTITNPYDKQIFWIKTNSTGNHVWNNTLGSVNDISARSIAIDPSNQSYITGYFRCDLSQISDTTNNLFNSVGFKDPYLIQVSDGGNRNYIKQFGGKNDDEGKGISAYQNNKPFICGSYIQDLNFSPGAMPVLGGNNYSLNPFFGAEPYHIYLVGDNSKNSFLETHVNNTYGIYDYHMQPVSDTLVGFITANQIPDYVVIENDTVHFCFEAELNYNHLTYPHAGPNYDYLWYDGTTTPFNTISATGNYWLRTERADDCAFDVDTIVAILEPVPQLPLLTDDHGVNVNTPGPNYNDYHYCEPESIDLLFSNPGAGISLSMIGPTQTYNGLGTHTINTAGQYSVHVENEYCVSNGEFILFLDQAIAPDTLDPDIILNTDVITGDSITICQGFPIVFHGIDLFENPGNFVPQIELALDTVMWNVDGVPVPNTDTASLVISPAQSGWLSVEMIVVVGYDNLCGVDTVWYRITKPFYVTVNSIPVWNPMVSGPSLLCPGDAEYLIAGNPDPSFSWSGPDPIWTNNYDSLLINTPGWYTYAGTITDTVTGCAYNLLYNQYLGLKNPPIITADVADGVVCPGDSIQLAVPNFYSTYYWINENGDTISNLSYCYVQDVGMYECHVVDAQGCLLVANAFEVFQYSTPTLTISPDNVLCAGETATINVVNSGNIDILWHYDNSTADSLVVSSPGVYVVELTQCNSTILDSVTIVNGTFNVGQILGDMSLCVDQDGVFYVNGAPTDATIEWYSGTDFVGSANPMLFDYSILENETTISVTVANACYSQTITDEVQLLPQLPLSISNDTVRLCYDDEETITVLSSNLDSIHWSTPFENIDDTEITFEGDQDYPNVTVVGFDQNGCATTPQVIIVHGSDYEYSVNYNFPTYCSGTEGTITITTTSDSIHWTTPFTVNYDSDLTYVLDEETSGLHTVKLWDSLGCDYTNYFNVNAILPPNLNLFPDTIFCLNDIYTYTAPNDSNEYVWLGLGNVNEITITGNQDYVLQITSPSGCVYYDTLFVETVDCGGPLPNVITPNGDGINDYFYFDDVFSQLENELFIINRWGNVVFHAAPYQNNFDGAGLNEGVYFYIYYPKGKSDKDGIKQGFIHLVK